MIIKLQGHEVAYAYGWLANAYGLSTNEPITRSLDPDEKVNLLNALVGTEKMCTRLELTVTQAHVPRVRRAVEDATSPIDIQNLVGELRTRMHDELKTKLFLFVPPIEANFYARAQAFGPDVANKFPDATTDIESAGDCIALGMDTAAVFHLMRVMERGVQALGSKLGVIFADDKNWQVVLNEINKNIAAISDKSLKAEYSSISAHLASVKLAWRNPVMHPKANYTDTEAIEIYNHVKTFMSHLIIVL
jgi:hypothetical protein